ncbi:MAG: sensor domain-containing phosphodiesterase [Mycobacteriaceae bacterium]
MALAAGRFAFLMALVNALDAGSRHTIAAVGAPLGTVARPGTLCDEVVRSGVPVVRRDITVLPLAAPGIRAYVGVPLTGREGPVIGTLCLSNTRPRTFSAEQMVQLVAIGAVVQDQLELVRRRGPWPAGSVADATELAAAIESRQVVPYYQPVVDLRTGRVDAVEDWSSGGTRCGPCWHPPSSFPWPRIPTSTSTSLCCGRRWPISRGGDRTTPGLR